MSRKKITTWKEGKQIKINFLHFLLTQLYKIYIIKIYKHNIAIVVIKEILKKNVDKGWDTSILTTLFIRIAKYMILLSDTISASVIPFYLT